MMKVAILWMMPIHMPVVEVHQTNIRLLIGGTTHLMILVEFGNMEGKLF